MNIHTEVANVRFETYDQYVGRAGKGQDGYFGNPVAVGRVCPECKKIHHTGESTLPCYKKYFHRRLETDPVFKARVLALKGKTLGCFCKPKHGFNGRLMCHAQVMAEYIDNHA